MLYMVFTWYIDEICFCCICYKNEKLLTYVTFKCFKRGKKEDIVAFDGEQGSLVVLDGFEPVVSLSMLHQPNGTG